MSDDQNVKKKEIKNIFDYIDDSHGSGDEYVMK